MTASTIIEKFQDILILDSVSGEIQIPESNDPRDRDWEGKGKGAKAPIQLICQMNINDVYQALLKSPYISYRISYQDSQISISSFEVSSEGEPKYFNCRFSKLGKKSCVFVGYVGTYYRPNEL